MRSNSLPNIPSLCDICMKQDAMQIVPDRSPGEWKFYVFCTICLDGFCSLFPISPDTIFDREIYGNFQKKCRKKSKRVNLK